MAATTIHFGPEWMRAKQHTSARQQQQPSPPPQLPSASHLLGPSASHLLGPSTYSALVTPLTHEPDKRDDARPFRYTKEDLLRIYKEGGGKGHLNLEVERWEGIVRDVASEPAGLRDMSEAEKKLFAGSLNSEIRRRQSTDLMNSLSSPSDRQRLNHPSSATTNTTRFGPFLGRRRDSTDQPPLSLPRKLSLSNTQGGPLSSSRDAVPSPRNRMGAFGSGFDGVLNSGESWSRKRPSVVTGGGLLVREEKEEDACRSEIKEEEEGAGHHLASPQDGDPGSVLDHSSSASPEVSPPPDGQVSSSGIDSISQVSTAERLNQSNSNPRATSLSSGPPPGLTDPASVEWSYLDPQGQVQGPFRADLMQKWFDEGYFTPDLLMKRSHLDMDWIAVGILDRRAGGGKIFLSQIFSGPPGLAIHTESPKSYSPIHEQNNMFNGYQPVPMRTLRTTLDPYPNGSSPADSPSSSLGGGRFANGSPDPTTIGGRTGNTVYSNDTNLGGRAFPGRVAFPDSTPDTRLSNNPLGRVPPIDTFNVYSGGADGSPWSGGPAQINSGFSEHEPHSYSNGFNGGTIGNPLPISHIQSINQEHFSDAMYSGMGSLDTHHDSPVARQPSDANGLPFNGNITNGLGSQFGAQAQLPHSSVSYVASQHRPSISPLGDSLPHVAEVPSVNQTPLSAIQPNNASPWATRNKPFEPPTAPSPVVPAARPQWPEWEWGTQEPVQPSEPSPWLIASLPIMDDVWREMPGPNSLTFNNLGQHNKQQQQEEEGADGVTTSPVDDIVSPSLDPQPTSTESTSVPVNVTAVVSQPVTPAAVSAPGASIQGPATHKARRKSTARDIQAPALKVVAQISSSGIKDTPPAPVIPVPQSKSVWAVEEESKRQRGSSVTVSLREIQEAEVRKVEARKVADKEKERVARVNTASSEESQPSFTSSWGLPTSQAGARALISPKETSATNSTSATPSLPVWTNGTPAPAAKKTMKEIQEEERKKKVVVKESMASAAARRAYAETTIKVPNAQAPSGPWTTVGPNGKPTPLANVPRQAVNSPSNNPAPAPATTSRSNSGTTRQAAAATTKAATPRVEDFPITPSHDFLKWLGESLKGLNSSVNLEEITSMLLSFPLDPDQSTIEIISDLIYANSTTLDGRRFASEYVNKRKTDAAARRGVVGASGSSNKPVSIADMVKTQPKPVQQEWGFKVVNKKKKGARS